MKRSLLTASSQAAKKFKMAEKTIVTHSGSFHCDESLACFLLHQTEEFNGSKIVRSRDPAVIDSGDIVVDVGAVYDPSKNRFDHHQRGFEETMGDEYSIKLSSAGLVYKHYGREVLKNVLSEENSNVVETLYWKIYRNLIMEIDAIDNGVTQFDGTAAYKINTNLSARVGRLNPRWNEEATDEKRLELFMKAVAMTGEEFVSVATHYHKSWYPAREIVEEAIKKRHEVHESGKIIQLSQYCPWTSHLFDIEKELNLGTDLTYVLFADSSAGWRVQAVPVKDGSFENRKALPEPWRGKRDEELSKESGIDGCVFAHASGFIGGNQTQEGALKMAVSALTF